MIRGIERRKIFNDDRDRENFVERLSALLPETKTECCAWSFLSNHAHFSLGSGPAGIARLMRRRQRQCITNWRLQMFENQRPSLMLTRNMDAWHNMGLTYLGTERSEEAIRCFKEALSLEERADTRRFLEEAYERMTD